MQNILTVPTNATPLQSTSATFKDYIPLIQTMVWPVFWLFIFLIFRKQITKLFELLLEQIQRGASVELGGFKVISKGVVEETSDLKSKVGNSKVEIVGDPDRFKLLFKAQVESEKGDLIFMKSTKAMIVPGGCVVQVTSERQNPDNSWSVAESLTFVPGDIAIKDDTPQEGRKTGHFLDTPDI